MSSIVYSTRCFIREQEYRLWFSVDNDGKNDRVSTIDDLWSKIDNEQSENVVNILNSFQLHFQLSTDEKIDRSDPNDDVIPQMISLNKLLSIKQTKKSQETTKNSKRTEIPVSGSLNIELSYVDISEIHLWSVKRIQLTIDGAAVADQLRLILTKFLAKLQYRPRHLLVFINPQCGKSKQKNIKRISYKIFMIILF